MRALFSQLSSFLIALIFAFILWAIATSEENPSREAFFPDALPIEIVNQPAGLALYGKSAETARVKARAPLALWEQLRASSVRVTMDLSGAGIGQYNVELKAQVSDRRLTIVAIEPPFAAVRLDQIKTRSLSIETELMDAPPVGYVSRTPTPNPARIQLNGPAIFVDQVTRVQAEVSVRGSRSTLTRQIALVAQDALGNAVAGVTLDPATAMITVPIEQRVGYKDVSVKTILKGNVAAGYWISNIVVAPSTTTVVGSAEALARMPGFVETFPIDVNAATGDIVKTVPLALPDDIALSENDGVLVQISITPILGGQTIRRAVIAQGLARGLAATISPDTVEVILSGPLPALAALSAQDVQVILDLTNLVPGSYSIKPRVSLVPGLLKVQSLLPDTVPVNITESKTTP